MRYIRTTILGGLIFLIPVGFVGFLLVQIYGVMQLIAQPIGRLVPLSNIGDIAIANVIAILLILGTCFAAGLVAHHLPIGDRIARLDQRLSALVPAYNMAKGALAGATEDDRLELDWKPVMVGDPAGVERPGLEIERLASGRVVVFLPRRQAPNRASCRSFLRRRYARSTCRQAGWHAPTNALAGALAPSSMPRTSPASANPTDTNGHDQAVRRSDNAVSRAAPSWAMPVSYTHL